MLCSRVPWLLLLGCRLLLLRLGFLLSGRSLLSRRSSLLRRVPRFGCLLRSSALGASSALRSRHRGRWQRLAGAQPAHAAGGLAAVEGGAGLAREGRQHGAEGGALVLGGAALDVARELPLV